MVDEDFRPHCRRNSTELPRLVSEQTQVSVGRHSGNSQLNSIPDFRRAIELAILRFLGSSTFVEIPLAGWTYSHLFKGNVSATWSICNTHFLQVAPTFLLNKLANYLLPLPLRENFSPFPGFRPQPGQLRNINCPGFELIPRFVPPVRAW
jgi:hypothetical protein